MLVVQDDKQIRGERKRANKKTVDSEPETAVVDSEPETYAVDKPAEAPVFKRGDRVDFWLSTVDGNLEGYAADVLRVFAGHGDLPIQYWINQIEHGTVTGRSSINASASPRHNTITARE